MISDSEPREKLPFVSERIILIDQHIDSHLFSVSLPHY